MDGKVAIEEHFVTPELEDLVLNPGWPQDAFRRTLDRLADVDERLELMDRFGIGVGLVARLGRDPGARRSGSRSSPRCSGQRRPRRAGRLAAGPLRRLRRGRAAGPFRGGGRGLARGRRARLPRGARERLLERRPVLRRRAVPAVLGAARGPRRPFYLHPRNPLESMREIYRGRPQLLGPTWALGVETATHALRLIVSGLFDRFASLQVVLGHLGEGLPFQAYRLEQRLRRRADVSLSRLPTVVLRENFYVSVSGNYHTPSLVGVLSELGPGRVMFAADHPFEDIADAAEWFDALSLDDDVRGRIASRNAERLLGLPQRVPSSE